jgi:hypothetical protein
VGVSPVINEIANSISHGNPHPNPPPDYRRRELKRACDSPAGQSGRAYHFAIGLQWRYDLPSHFTTIDPMGLHL